MPGRYFSVPVGGKMKSDVTTSPTAVIGAVELGIADLNAPGQSKMTVLQAIEAIRQKIVEGNWPPA